MLQALRRFDDALDDYEKAISHKPEYADAHWNKSLQLLLLGEFSEGWKLYEWRWKRESFKFSKRKFKQPLWLGKESLQGKTILLHWEQGLGDTIQFSRYAKEVSKLGCRVLLEVQKRLFEFMKDIEGVDELIPFGSDIPPFDFYIPLMSLPFALGTTIDNIPSSNFYLKSNDEKLANWSAKLGSKRQPRVGIVWSGGTDYKNDQLRSMKLEEILSSIPEGFQIISLQKEVKDTDLKTLKSYSQILHFGTEQNDFTDAAALCDLMDIIVSVDTSVAHLAGALGKPVNVLLHYNSDFRWLLDKDSSPWYSSMKLFRQGPERCWEIALNNVKAHLERCI